MNGSLFRRPLVLVLISLSVSACNTSNEQPQAKVTKVTVTSLQKQDVTLTEQYVCQIKSHHFIDIRAPQTGSVGEVEFKTGQRVKEGDLLFRLVPSPTSRLNSANAEHLYTVKAPFEGIVDRPEHEQGSFVKQGEVLTSLFDNRVMSVYFNVPEARYLEFKANEDQHKKDMKIELVLANGKKFDQPGEFGGVRSEFEPSTGNISFRADFLNPAGLLRHGQRGTVLISRVKNDAIVVPQRATFEINLNRFVYVVDKDNMARQREIVVQNELDDQFVIKSGVGAGDKIVVGGMRQLRDGEKVESQASEADKVVANLEQRAE